MTGTNTPMPMLVSELGVGVALFTNRSGAMLTRYASLLREY